METSNRRSSPVRFGKYEVDFGTGELRLEGVKVKLQQQPFQVLAALLARPGQLVSREEIRRLVWNNGTFVDFERGLNKAVNRLRDALGHTAGAPRFIETRSRRGYRFVAPISRNIQSLAVLPFKNLSGDPNLEHWADGMADELNSRLPAPRKCFDEPGNIPRGASASVDLVVRPTVQGSPRSNASIRTRQPNLLPGSITITTTVNPASLGFTPLGSGVVTRPVDSTTQTQPVTITFTSVSVAGLTTLTSSDTGPALPAGFQLGSPATFYDLSTTATFSGPVGVCINYTRVTYSDESTLGLFHYESGAWFDRTTSLDTVNKIICASVTSFSPFAVFGRRTGSPLTSLGPANVWIGLTDSDDVGIRFDLRAEAYRNGSQLVRSGELTSVVGGSSGFNNAHQQTINMTLTPGIVFSSRDTFSIRVYARNACSGSGKNSGRARLWYNDTQANSRLGAAINTTNIYYLSDGLTLGLTPSAGPKQTIDIQAGAKCSPYVPFGTWSVAQP